MQIQYNLLQLLLGSVIKNPTKRSISYYIVSCWVRRGTSVLPEAVLINEMFSFQVIWTCSTIQFSEPLWDLLHMIAAQINGNSKDFCVTNLSINSNLNPSGKSSLTFPEPYYNTTTLPLYDWVHTVLIQCIQVKAVQLTLAMHLKWHLLL